MKKTSFFLQVVTYAFPISMFCWVILNNIVDLDLFHQMALVRESIALGHLPRQDLFAYTPTVNPSVHHEWGAGVIAYFLGTWFGGVGILALKYFLTFLIVLFFGLCIKKRGIGGGMLILIAPIAITLMKESFATTRAQMYSFVFVACLLWVFDLEQKGNRRWFLFWIPLYLLWINLHGGFIAGFGLLGAFWFEQWLRRKQHVHLILVGIAMVGLIAVNPYGLQYYPYLLNAVTMDRPYIEEWYPLWRNPDVLRYATFLFSLLVVLYSVKKIGIRKAEGIAVLLATALASILCVRLLFFYGLAWAVYVSGYMKNTPLGHFINDFYGRFSKFVIPILSILAVAFLVRVVSMHSWKLIVPSDHIEAYGGAHPIYPVGPVNYLKEVGFKGNLMVHFNWGSYVSWKLYPDVYVSMDSRYEVAYPEWVVDENIRFYAAKEDWQNTLAKYPHDLVLVSKKQPVAKEISQQRGWEKVYTDHVFELYARPGLIMPVVDWTGQNLEGTFP